MQTWDLNTIETPGGSRTPVVLHSEEGAARAVLVALDPGQELGDHEVKEHAFLVVIEGSVDVEAGGERTTAGAGTLVSFAREERRTVSSAAGARVLIVLAPWPGAGHYRGGGAEAREAGAPPA